jgi:hypothetical protein
MKRDLTIKMIGIFSIPIQLQDDPTHALPYMSHTVRKSNLNTYTKSRRRTHRAQRLPRLSGINPEKSKAPGETGLRSQDRKAGWPRTPALTTRALTHSQNDWYFNIYNENLVFSSNLLMSIFLFKKTKNVKFNRLQADSTRQPITSP